MAWEKIIHHYQVPLRRETRALLGQYGLPTTDEYVEDMVSYGWEKLIEWFASVEWDGEATLYRWVANVIEHKIDSMRRNHRRTRPVADFGAAGGLDDLTDEELFDRLQADSQRPTAEDMYLYREKHIQFTRLYAVVLENDLTRWHSRLMALWFLYCRDAQWIALFYHKTKLNSTLVRAKHKMLIALRSRLLHALTLMPDDQDFLELLAMIDKFATADKDGHLTQSHPFLEYIQHTLPHPLPDLDDPRWFQRLIVALKSGRQ
ncbi:MAG: hypothetical protein SF162_01865 [bacterium]|nr:hypothetical protein [bacterium]